MSELMEKVDTLQRAHEEFSRSVAMSLKRITDANDRLEATIDKSIEDNNKRQLQREEEFRKYQEESEKKRKEEQKAFNKQMGELSNRLGTLAEDMVFPSLPRVIQEKFAVTTIAFYENGRFQKDGRSKEFDAFAYSEDYVFLNYTVATLKNDKVDEMAKEIAEFRFFQPEHAEKKFIGILSALRIPDNVLHYAEKKGYLVLGLGEYLMEIKNQPNFIPKKF